MKEQDLEIIKSRTLVLKNGEKSGSVVLVDPVGGDMYLPFELKYIGEQSAGTTSLSASDPHHADFVIEVRPNSMTKPTELMLIGTYGKGTPLYLGFVVQPQIAGEHNVIITFYKEKEVPDGTNNN